jgi:hypothetical protein
MHISSPVFTMIRAWLAGPMKSGVEVLRKYEVIV